MSPLMICDALHDLRSAFRQYGFDIKLVGGCVRDWVLDEWANGQPHDIDLCTDATPDQQQAVYKQNGIAHYDTGLQHGTWSVVLDDILYEITSLRTETDCDGRHATVSYTTDWLLDMSRRDLTFNAMAMSFDGLLTDPFGGQDDLENGRARFVGVAGNRMREDYLRILRWFRFHARFAKGRFSPEDVLTNQAIVQNMHGLQGISRERVWSEMKRILSEPFGPLAIFEMIRMGVMGPIGLPVPSMYDRAISYRRLCDAHQYTRDPVSLIATYLGTTAHVERLAAAWHFSGEERHQALRVAHHVANGLPGGITQAKGRVAVDRIPVETMAEVLRVRGQPVQANELLEWKVPVFPVTGDDLMATGVKQGREMGRIINDMRAVWRDSHYMADKAELLKGFSK